MKFKCSLFIVFILLYSASLYSQHTKDIVGKWKVIKVELSADAKKEEKEKIGMVKSVFSKVIFYFNADSSFKLDAPDKNLASPDGVWKFDEVTKKIAVVERENSFPRGKLMDIIVKLSNGNYVFIMNETPLILTVLKVVDKGIDGLQVKAKVYGERRDLFQHLGKQHIQSHRTEQR